MVISPTDTNCILYLYNTANARAFISGPLAHSSLCSLSQPQLSLCVHQLSSSPPNPPGFSAVVARSYTSIYTGSYSYLAPVTTLPSCYFQPACFTPSSLKRLTPGLEQMNLFTFTPTPLRSLGSSRTVLG